MSSSSNGDRKISALKKRTRTLRNSAQIAEDNRRAQMIPEQLAEEQATDELNAKFIAEGAAIKTMMKAEAKAYKRTTLEDAAQKIGFMSSENAVAKTKVKPEENLDVFKNDAARLGRAAASNMGRRRGTLPYSPVRTDVRDASASPASPTRSPLAGRSICNTEIANQTISRLRQKRSVWFGNMSVSRIRRLFGEDAKGAHEIGF